MSSFSRLHETAQELTKEPQLLKEAFERFSRETERLEKAYSALQEQFHKLHYKFEASHQILTHISQGILFIDGGGSIALFNPAAERITGVMQEEVLQRTFWDVFRDDLFGFSMKTALAEEKAPKISLLTLTSEHLTRDIEVSSSFLPAQQGIILLLKDMTEIRHLEQVIQRNERLKELGEMAAGLAHEIRNPLGGIEGFAALLIRDLKEMPPLQIMAQAILDGARILNRLVTNVLQYARPLTMHFSAQDLSSLLKEIADLIRAEHRNHCLVELGLPVDVFELAFDADRIKLALLNIIENAVQASKLPGKIEIKLFREENFAHIAVTDFGCGIPDENLEKIFIPFFTTKSTGTGLGLSEAHKVVQAHGGSIEVLSKLGEGSTFIVKLPLHKSNHGH